jgi:curved DNA-binding protein CbpA
MRTHYETVGVDPTASQNDISEAQQRLTKLSRSGSAVPSSASSADVALAFAILADPKKREEYDASILRTATALMHKTGPGHEATTTIRVKHGQAPTSAPISRGSRPVAGASLFTGAGHSDAEPARDPMAQQVGTVGDEAHRAARPR